MRHEKCSADDDDNDIRRVESERESETSESRSILAQGLRLVAHYQGQRDLNGTLHFIAYFAVGLEGKLTLASERFQ